MSYVNNFSQLAGLVVIEEPCFLSKLNEEFDKKGEKQVVVTGKRVCCLDDSSLGKQVKDRIRVDLEINKKIQETVLEDKSEV